MWRGDFTTIASTNSRYRVDRAHEKRAFRERDGALERPSVSLFSSNRKAVRPELAQPSRLTFTRIQLGTAGMSVLVEPRGLMHGAGPALEIGLDLGPVEA